MINISPQISAEIRGWLTVVFSIFGFTVAYRTYSNNQKQRRLENSFKLISLFKESLQEDDIERWKDILCSSSEPSGAKEGFFIMHEYPPPLQFPFKFPGRRTKQKEYLAKIAPTESEETGYFDDIFIVRQFPFSELFSEFSPDDGAIQRIAELFDLISFQILNQTVDERLIYFELGQLMDTVQLWVSFIDNPYTNKSFLQEHFPSFFKLYKKRIIQKSWKTRTYTNNE